MVRVVFQGMCPVGFFLHLLLGGIGSSSIRN